MPLVFAIVAPPGSSNVWLVVGALTFAITLIAAFAAYKSPETYRFRSADLGVPGAQPVPLEEYHRLRNESIAEAKRERAARREQAAAR